MDGIYVCKKDLVASENFHLHCLINLDQNGGTLINYTKSFCYLYHYLKDDISLEAASIWFIIGLKYVPTSANLQSNWINGKYSILFALQIDATDNSLRLNIWV